MGWWNNDKTRVGLRIEGITYDWLGIKTWREGLINA